jgi:hypothetical protein
VDVIAAVDAGIIQSFNIRAKAELAMIRTAGMGVGASPIVGGIDAAIYPGTRA